MSRLSKLYDAMQTLRIEGLAFPTHRAKNSRLMK